jgi:hypothetical protein
VSRTQWNNCSRDTRSPRVTLPARVDNVSNAGAIISRQNNPPTFNQTSTEVASLMLRSRMRGLIVSSQFCPCTPSIFKGRVSRRPSASSLASSATALSSQPVHAAFTEPHQEDASMVPASGQCIHYYAKIILGDDIILLYKDYRRSICESI